MAVKTGEISPKAGVIEPLDGNLCVIAVDGSSAKLHTGSAQNPAHRRLREVVSHSPAVLSPRLQHYLSSPTVYPLSPRSVFTELQPLSKAQVQSRWQIGHVLLLLVIVLWVISSFLVSDLVNDDGFDNPFLLTYITTSSFSLYLVPKGISVAGGWLKGKLSRANLIDKASMVCPLINRKTQPICYGTCVEERPENQPSKAADTLRRLGQFRPENEPNERQSVRSPLTFTVEEESMSSSVSFKAISTSETAIFGLKYSLLYFGTNYCTNLSLKYTTVSSQTIIQTTSSVFTFIFSVSLFHLEKFSYVKAMSIACSIIGIVLITVSSSDDSESEFTFISMMFGNAISLAGAVIYGFYTVSLRVSVGDESNCDMTLLFGFIGLFTLIFYWPIVAVLDVVGWETFPTHLPNLGHVAKVIALNIICTIFGDFSFAIALLLTSPIVATVAVSGTIPAAIIGEYWFTSTFPTEWQYYFGALLVCIAFITINQAEKDEVQEQQQELLEAIVDEMEGLSVYESSPNQARNVVSSRPIPTESSIYHGSNIDEILSSV